MASIAAFPSCLFLAPPLPSGKQPGTSLDLWLLSTKGTPLSPPLPAFTSQREGRRPLLPDTQGTGRPCPVTLSALWPLRRVSRGAWVPWLDLPRPRFHALWVQPPPLPWPQQEGAALCLGQVPGQYFSIASEVPALDHQGRRGLCENERGRRARLKTHLEKEKIGIGAQFPGVTSQLGHLQAV